MRRFEDNVNEGVFLEVATVIVSVQVICDSLRESQRNESSAYNAYI